jgi:spartin
VHEDPVLYEKGHESDPVVVELPEGVDELSETEVMIRTIPPEDRGWMMKGAMFAR